MHSSSNQGIILFLAATTALIFLMATFIAFVIFRYQKRQDMFKKQIEDLKIAHDSAMLEAELEIQEQTMQHISREIHDNIGLGLTLAKLNLNTINISEKNIAQEKIDHSVKIITNSINDLAGLGKSFNANYIAANGLIKAVENELDNISRIGAVHSNLNITGNPLFMDSQKELLLFRIMQEALNNSIKHSSAKNLNILLHYDKTQIEVKVSDDGKGLPDNTAFRKKGIGLSNMELRAKMIHGDCLIKNNNTAGTTVYINIPY